MTRMLGTVTHTHTHASNLKARKNINLEMNFLDNINKMNLIDSFF